MGLGSAEYAFVEVAKTIVKARRSDKLNFVTPECLLEVPDSHPTTEEHSPAPGSDRTLD